MQVKYQYVRQTRVPKTLAQVLVVNCGLQASRGAGTGGWLLKEACQGARRRREREWERRSDAKSAASADRVAAPTAP